MMLARKQILPNGYFKKPSTRIGFEKFNLRVPIEVENMVAHDSGLGLIASISSYGFGGKVFHLVHACQRESATTNPPGIYQVPAGTRSFASMNHVLSRLITKRCIPDRFFLQSVSRHCNDDNLIGIDYLIGGLSPKACNALSQRYKEQCSDIDPLALSAHLGSRARQMPWRTYTVAIYLTEATFPDPFRVEKRPNPLVFCFSGQGPQHWQQGRELFAAFSVFRESIYDCDKIHEEYTGHSFLKKTGLFLPDPPRTSPLAKNLSWPADIISVAITFFQIAMFDLLTAIGVRPDAILGHSIGETAVLYASGAMPRSVSKISSSPKRELDMIRWRRWWSRFPWRVGVLSRWSTILEGRWWRFLAATQLLYETISMPLQPCRTKPMAKRKNSTWLHSTVLQI